MISSPFKFKNYKQVNPTLTENDGNVVFPHTADPTKAYTLLITQFTHYVATKISLISCNCNTIQLFLILKIQLSLLILLVLYDNTASFCNH